MQRVGLGASEGHISEDALTINVSRRHTTAPGPRPVLVFLYGGANIGGTSSYPMFEGLPFLEADDMVYVTGNYRVGPFGFVDFSRYSSPEHPIDGNLGLRDQLAILEWVNRNITAFGGDPGNVTLAGQSAGALGVSTLMTVPRAAGLFHAAIAQSSPVASVVDRARGDDRARRVVEALGASDRTPAEALAEADSPRLLAAADTGLASEQDEFPGILSYASVVDGELLPEHPLDVLAEGRAHPVPLLIGTTDNEGTLFARGAKVSPAQQVETLLTHAGPAAASRLRAAYPGLPRSRAAIALSGDFLFWAPSVRAAEGQARIAPVWMYRYDYATPLLRALRLGATHGMDLMAVFGPANSELGRKAHLLGGRKDLARVTATMQATWMQMVTRHSQQWDQYVAPDRSTLIVTPRPHVEADPRADRREAWEQFPYYR
ncbi:carboxylesterase family protein [Naumannella halotolerans]|uniref:carboxylesterase family protein n=1 Tax=Naumannella halotolerans TaxID=993414 RepID=UPI001061E754